jgi:hypothetical protein
MTPLGSVLSTTRIVPCECSHEVNNERLKTHFVEILWQICNTDLFSCQLNK